MTQAAELFVVDQLMNRRMIAAHGAIRIAAQIERIDLHRQGVEAEQASEQFFPIPYRLQDILRS